MLSFILRTFWTTFEHPSMTHQSPRNLWFSLFDSCCPFLSFLLLTAKQALTYLQCHKPNITFYGKPLPISPGRISCSPHSPLTTCPYLYWSTYLGGSTGGPMAKTPCSQCRGLGLIPSQKTRCHMLQLKIPHAATKTWCSQIKNE